MHGTANYIPQAGAIAFWNGRICLVTSRNGKRWVVPKGCLEPGKTAAEIALQEAWEEAGLVGEVQEEPLGAYVYEKTGKRCRVTVFLMFVREVKDIWPEKNSRTRSWAPPSRAMAHIAEYGLRQLIRRAAKLEDAVLSC